MGKKKKGLYKYVNKIETKKFYRFEETANEHFLHAMFGDIYKQTLVMEYKLKSCLLYCA